MLPSLQPAITQLRLIPQIVRLADPQLYARLRDTEPFFALSGTLTMYAHDVTRLADIARIFDALLASPSTYSVYLFAMLVLARRDELLAVPVDEPDVLHWTLSRLPQREMDGGSSDGDGLTRTPSGRPLASGSGGLDLDALVRDAASLQQRIPPTSLPSWRRPWQISPASVLLTAADPAAVARQSVEVDGRRFFERQAADLRRREMLERWANWVWQRRHVAAGLLLGAGGAVVVGVAAWWWVRKV